MTYTEYKAGWGPAESFYQESPHSPTPPQEARPFPHTYPKTVALAQQKWVGVEEGTAPILIVSHCDSAQVDEIKAVAPLPLLYDHTPATKPGKRPRPVDLGATQSPVHAGRSGLVMLFALEYESTDWDEKGPQKSAVPAPSSLTSSPTFT